MPQLRALAQQVNSFLSQCRPGFAAQGIDEPLRGTVRQKRRCALKN